MGTMTSTQGKVPGLHSMFFPKLSLLRWGEHLLTLHDDSNTVTFFHFLFLLSNPFPLSPVFPPANPGSLAEYVTHTKSMYSC